MCNCKKPKPSVKKKTTLSSSNVLSKKRSRNPFSSFSKKNKSTDTESEIENISGQTLKDKLLAFSDLLGIKNPLPEKILIAAIQDPNYAGKLLANRENPIQLYDLFNNPPVFSASGSSTTTPGLSSAELISKAGKALFKWGFSGFMTVTSEILKKREDACLACPNLVEATKMIQRLSASSKISSEIGKRTGNKSCSKCGCVVKNKMRLATETCPEELPETPGTNRWGEKI